MVHISIVGLLEMLHDWTNLKKYIVDWNMVGKMGEPIMKRMKQRVCEDVGMSEPLTNNKNER